MLIYSVVSNLAYKIRVLWARALSLTAGTRVRSLSLIEGPFYTLGVRNGHFRRNTQLFTIQPAHQPEMAVFVIFNKPKYYAENLDIMHEGY
jgi:hypothetical protein